MDLIAPRVRGKDLKLSRKNCHLPVMLLDLPFYDPLSIAEKTKGRVAEDPQYLKFAYRTPKTIFWKLK